MAVLTIGTLYIPNYHGIAWTQPGGPNTVVLPQQQNGPFANYPVPGQFFSEFTGLWTFGCGHQADQPTIFRDFDSSTSTSAAVITCPLCSYLQRLIEPYEAIMDPLINPIVFP